MKCVGVVLLLLSVCGARLGFAQQAGSATPLITIADRQAVEEWSRAISADRIVPGGYEQSVPSDPAGDTQFLLSLREEQRYGAFLVKQRCNACHGAAMNSPQSYGPRLSRITVDGREDATRRQIMEGSANMPAFRYSLQPSQVNLIIEYLKAVEPPCGDCGPGDYRR